MFNGTEKNKAKAGSKAKGESQELKVMTKVGVM